MPELLRSIARSYVHHFPIEKGKFHVAEAMRRISPREKVISQVAGRFLMELDLSEYLQGMLFYFGYYERQLTRLIKETVRPGWVMVDAGANVGTFSLLAASLGATCYAFEASPTNCALLRRNISLNKFTGITVHECALSDRSGVTQFFVYEEPGMGKAGGLSAMFRRGAGREIQVPMKSLDVVLGDLPRIDIIKCDVEGADFLVLRGAQSILKKLHPIVVVEAVEGLANQLGGSVADILATLWECGYEVYTLRASGSALVPKTTSTLDSATLVARFPRVD